MFVNKVTTQLHNMKILTDEMKENIEVEQNRFSKARKLLDIVARRGPHAFTALRMSLIKAGNFALAKQLHEDSNASASNQIANFDLHRPLVIDFGQSKEIQNDEMKEKTTYCQSPVIDLDQDATSLQENGNDKRNDKQRCFLNIGDNFFVTANTYNGQLRIHIREYNASSNGKRLFPTKKGVTFTLQRWVQFKSMIPDIAESLESHSDMDSEQSWHLGGGVYAIINPEYPTVNIRHFWKPEDATEPKPTRKGVMLTRYRFRKLQEILNDINGHVPELEDIVPCIFQDDHMNQEGMLQCPECTPFGYNDFMCC